MHSQVFAVCSDELRLPFSTRDAPVLVQAGAFAFSPETWARARALVQD
jgi:hypothetical protein